MGPRAQLIQQLLKSEFPSFDHLEVVDESHMHNVPEGAESHFKIILVSSEFTDVSRVKRQQRVYKALQSVFQQGLHALAQKTYSPEEWAEVPESRLISPDCKGGSSH